MKRPLPALRAVAIIAVALVSVNFQQSAVRVERIIDGDTLVLAGLGTARLIGVNTPETVDPRKPVQAFGKEARAFLEQLLKVPIVRVEYDHTRLDRYGRTLVYLHLANGIFVNREIIRQGFGNAYTEFPFKYMEDFRSAEREAREARRGLWAASAPITADATRVFITKTGIKYHRADCRFLDASKEAIRLDETPGHYEACRVCSPPRLK